MSDTPRLEILTPAANAAARRLASVAEVKAVLDLTTSTDDAVLEAMIDRACALMATYCRLARVGATPPTFAEEELEATWDARQRLRPGLLLPWRFPVAAISAVVEDGVDLGEGDYRLDDGAELVRLVNGAPSCWSSGAIVVTWTAGWVLASASPDDLKAACVEQVKHSFLARSRDSALRSEQVPDVYAASYSDAVVAAALLPGVQAALDAYRAPPV